MDEQALWSLLFFAGLFGVLILRLIPRRARVFITDYQQGVRFVRGSFVRLEGPGSYLSGQSDDQITVVDMRPLPFLVERFFFQDGMQNPSVISIGAELVVTDPYAAVTLVKDRVQDSIAIVRDALRIHFGKTIADPTPSGRRIVSEKLTSAANTELSRIGMQIQNMEITEFWSRPMRGYSTGAN
jgi:hypothetical protein